MNKLEIYIRGTLVETVEDFYSELHCDVISIEQVIIPDGITYELTIYSGGDEVYSSDEHGRLEFEDVELFHV